MVAYSTVEGYPYPLPTEPADGPVDLGALALAADVEPAAWLAAFSAATHAEAFLLRSSANSGTFGPFSAQNVSFDQVLLASSTLSISSGNVTVPSTELPGWWYVGTSLGFTAGGSVTAGALMQAEVISSYTDAVSLISTTAAARGETAETNTGGESVVLGGMVKCGPSGLLQVYAIHTDQGAAATRLIVANALFWGFRLGDA